MRTEGEILQSNGKRNQRAKALWQKRASKKRKPDRDVGFFS